jgi:predicted DNA-binding WGR domain protein
MILLAVEARRGVCVTREWGRVGLAKKKKINKKIKKHLSDAGLRGE